MYGRFFDLGLLALRFAGLYLALGHGWGKVVSLASGEGARFIEGVSRMGFPFPEGFAWAAAAAEFLGGLMVAAGLFTRVSAGFCAFTLFIAAFVRHRAHEQWLAAAGAGSRTTEELTQLGNPEMAFCYLLIFTALVLIGPGRLSLDHMFWERPGRR